MGGQHKEEQNVKNRKKGKVVETEDTKDHVTDARRRKKQLYTAIQNQMEFYFSIPNLSKDRFMGNLLKNDISTPVDISLFLNFNKIRALTTSTKDIAKALNSSTLLSVVNNCTQVVCKEQRAITESPEDCILYVENIPSYVDHDWMTEMFSKFGKVVYISLPRYYTSQKLKGFGFVEFQTTESMAKALEAFERVGCRLPSDLDPNNLCSIISFNSEKAGQEEPPAVSEERGARPPKRKMEAPEEEAPEEEAQDCKKVKVEVEDEDVGENGAEEDSERVAKKNRNRHKKKKKKKQEEISVETSGIQVMSKAEWKKLRNRYLFLQRRSTKNMRYDGAQDFNCYYNTQAPEEGIGGACVSAGKFNKKAKMKEILSVFEFIPGVIVHVEMDEPIENQAAFKATARSLGKVQHVDVNHCDCDAYIRCSTAEVAQDIVNKKLFPHMNILEGKDEISYWYKMVKDKEVKQSRKKVKQVPQKLNFE